MSGSGATTEPGDIEAQLGWRPLPDVPARFRAAVDGSRVALAGFWRANEVRALDELVAIWRGVVEDPGFDGSSVAFRRDVWNRLALALNWRGSRRAKQLDLRSALDAWDRALAIADAGWHDYAVCLSNMALTVVAEFALFGAADMDRAVQLGEEAVEAAPADEPAQLARCLLAAANAYASRHRIDGRREDIDRSVSLSERSLEEAASQPRLVSDATWQLAQSLGQRYDSFNDLDDLRRAIALLEGIVDQVANESERARLASVLGSLLRKRWSVLRRPSDLDRAIEFMQMGVGTAHGTTRPIRITNLGNALLDRWDVGTRIDDLERAAAMHARAVELSDPTDWQLAARLNNAGNSMLALARARNDGAALEHAIGYYERAVAATGPDAQELASRQYNLGRALVVAAESDPAGGLDERIRGAFQAACASGLDRSLQWALEASRAWGEWAARRANWPEAASAYGSGVEALSRLFVGQLTRDDKEAWLVQAAGLQAQGVYAAARARRLADAVLAAERARAMLLSDALERDRANLEQISASGYGDLAERFRAAAEHWRAVAGVEEGGSGGG
jgi:tetratricopeptide (TPR) repeat protein